MSQGIQLNIQLPLEELGRFSHLLDQLQQLMAADGSSTAREAEKSPSFDPQRFQQLLQAEQLSGQIGTEAIPTPAPAGSPAVSTGSLTQAPAAQAELSSAQQDATAVQAELTLSQQNTATAQAELSSIPEAPTVQAELLSSQLSAATARAELSTIPEAPAAQAELSFLADAPGAEGEVSFLAAPPTAQSELSAVPEISAHQIQAAMEEGEIPTAQPDEMLHLGEDVSSDQPRTPEEGNSPPPEEAPSVQEFLELSAPRSAGYYPQVQLPEAPGGVWGGIQEELTFSGPAPLTAEAVSLAFQRDDRRYDNGFPLY